MNENRRLIYSPSTLNREVRFHLEQGYPGVWIRGEVSNFSRPRSGHAYFSLKDARSQVRCVWFRSRNHYARVDVANGSQIIARGRLSLFEPRGDFQFIVDHVEDAGEGALRRQFDELKARLAAEGVFAQAVERPLPKYPTRIAIVTAPQGAALQDVRAVFYRRYPLVRTKVFATSVQGDGAAIQIRSALREAISANPDAVLLTRGGGSLEDLWPFNDEQLARMIAASTVPIVSAVGHEIDFTIADFAADYRAATPTAGAELLTPDGAELMAQLERSERAMVRCQSVQLERYEQTLDHLSLRLQSSSPLVQSDRGLERLSQWSHRLLRITQARIDEGSGALNQMQTRLAARHPIRMIEEASGRRERADAALHGAIKRRMENAAREAARVQAASRPAGVLQQIRSGAEQISGLKRRLLIAMTGALDRLEAEQKNQAASLRQLSPIRVLERGFSITTDPKTGKAIRSQSQISDGDTIITRVADGQFSSTVAGEDPS